MTDIAAALGQSQLTRIKEFNAKRAELAKLYRDLLNYLDDIMPLSDPSYPMQHAWHLFIVRLDIDKSGRTRDEFMHELKLRGIGTGIHFRAVHLQKYYRETMITPPGFLSNTEWNSERICSLPLFPGMNYDDAILVVNAIKEVLKK